MTTGRDDDRDSDPTGPVDPPLVISDADGSTSDALMPWERVKRFSPGEPLGERYTIVEEIGAGGMGVVYKAVDRTLGRPVALKLLRRRAMTESGAARFRRELTLAQRVRHPNVCRVHDLGEVEGMLYISMEHVDGQRLDRLILAMGHLSPKQTVALSRQLFAGLAAIHSEGIVHRDLKPSNLMIDHTGHVFIMDFGLAVQPGGAERVTSTGAVLGTLAYLSPEQSRGHDVDSRSDIYAAGLILFEMLTGRCAPGDEVALPLALRDAHERCPKPSELAPDVPLELDEVVMRCLAREPASRFASAAEVEHALGDVQALFSSGTSGHRSPAPAPSPGLLPSKLVWPVALLLSVVTAAAVWLSGRGTDAPATPATIAVLPLAYRGDVDRAYLKDLLPLLVTEQLRAVKDLQVSPFATTRGFQADESLTVLAEQLAVATALYGELDARSEPFKLAVRLLRSGSPEPILTRQLEGDEKTIVAAAAVLARDVVRALGVAPGTPAARERSPEALALYMKGRRSSEGWDVARNYEQAAESLRRAITIDPTFAEAHAALAIALWNEYELNHTATLVEPALSAAERAVALRPDLPEAQLALGTVQLGVGRSTEASLAFESAYKLAPGDDAVCRKIAAAFDRLGRAEDAERFYGRAIDLRPRYWENYNFKGVFHLRRGELEEAKTLFRKVIELRPESVAGYNNLGAAHIWDGDPEGAEPFFRASLGIEPEAGAHNNLGVVYYMSGRFAEAAQEFGSAASLKASPEYYGNLGDAYRQMGKKNEAAAAYRKAIERGDTLLRVNPADAGYRAAFATWLAGAGRCADQRREAYKAIKDGGSKATVQYYAAVAAAICGDRARALEYATGAARGGALHDLRTNPDLAPVLKASAKGRALLTGIP